MITYPVPPDSRWTFKSRGETYRGRPWPRADGMPIQSGVDDLVALRESESAKPSFNPLTQKLSGAWVDDPQANTAVFTWSVVSLTAEEAAAAALEADRDAKRQLVAQAIPTLRQWASDARGVTVTSGNAVATLQTVVNRLGTFFDRFADLLEGTRIDR